MENVDWAALPFNYHKTDYNVRNSYKDGKWGEPELTQDEYISVHMSAPLPALRRRVVRRVESLSRRRRQGAALPSRRERQAFRRDGPQTLHGRTARRNLRRDVPHGGQGQRAVRTSLRTGATLYLRPLEIGMGAFLGVHPAKEFIVCVFVSPVGAYFRRASNRFA